MKVLLTIGHTSILLPDDKGVTSIIKALSRGIVVYDRTYGDNPKVEFVAELNLEMKIVPRDTRITGLPKAEKTKPLALREPGTILL